MAEVFRIRSSIAYSGGSSGGKTEYFESCEALATRALEIELDLRLDSSRYKATREHVHRRRKWREFFKRHQDDHSLTTIEPVPIYPLYKNVFAVEQFLNDEWLAIEVTFVEPRVLLDLPKGGTLEA